MRRADDGGVHAVMDLLSTGAIGAVFGAVGSGMASEAGKPARESAGGMVRRLAGREVPAPATPDDVHAIARMVHDRVHADPELALAWTRFARGVRVPDPVTGPGRHCLPAAPRSFTDREDALKLLDKEATRAFDGRPRLALLHGPEGIGTSTLAFHWGARQVGRFPDGQLYADLRAFGPEPVLATLLRQLGLPDEDIPPSVADGAVLFRRSPADRRALVVLDHARSAAQVQPLPAPAPDVVTLVVARHPLLGLDAAREVS